MAKTKTTFYCDACGSELSKWAGQCPDCKAWNSVKEFRQAALGGVSRMSGYTGTTSQQVTELSTVSDQKVARIEVQTTGGKRLATLSSVADVAVALG